MFEAWMSWRRGKAYEQDLRCRVLACPEMTLREVASRFGISPSYVSKVRARLRELGKAVPVCSAATCHCASPRSVMRCVRGRRRYQTPS
jgi:hypothetical protein